MVDGRARASHRLSVYLVIQCIFLSHVVEAGKGGNPRHFSDALSRMRHLGAFCLVL